MPEAGRRAGVSSASILRSLRNAGVTVVTINSRAYAVDEAEFAAFLEERGELKPGRPTGKAKRADNPVA